MAGVLPPFEFLAVVAEQSYGVPMGGFGSPTPIATLVASGQAAWIRLAGANRFGMRAVPTKRNIDFGGGFASPGYSVAEQWGIAGALEVIPCYSQAAFLCGWALQPLNAGLTTPWTYSGSYAGDLASCTIYHGIMRSDTSIKRTAYYGCKVPTVKLSSSPTGTSLSLSLRASSKQGLTYYAGGAPITTSDPTSGTFPAPADTVFPTDELLFIQTLNNFTIGGLTLTFPLSMDINIDNKLDALFFNSPFIIVDQKRGRTGTAACKLLYTATPDWRADMEALTSRSASFAWSNGPHSVTIGFQGNNLLDSLADDLQPGRQYEQTVTWKYQRDIAAGDIAVTVT